VIQWVDALSTVHELAIWLIVAFVICDVVVLGCQLVLILTGLGGYVECYCAARGVTVDGVCDADVTDDGQWSCGRLLTAWV